MDVIKKLICNRFYYDYNNDYRSLIFFVETERSGTTWVSNIINYKNGEIHLAFYENFCKNPQQEIRKMFALLGKSYDEKILKSINIPSPLSRNESAIIVGDNLIDSWRKYFNYKQIRRAVNILSIFGLNGIYSEQSMPNIETAYNLLKKM